MPRVLRLVPALALLIACRSATPPEPRTGDVVEPQAPRAEDEDKPANQPRAEPDEPEATSEPSRVLATPYTPPSRLGEPIAVQRAQRTRTVYTEPSFDASLRGRIEFDRDFHVYQQLDNDEGCEDGWLEVADGGWVCAKHTRPSQGTPVSLPVDQPDQLLPYIYVRHKKHDKPDTPKIPVYRRLSAMRAGEEPIEWLEPYGTYAFKRRIHNKGNPVWIDESLHAVPAKDLEVFEPSEFAGRDLAAAPVPDDRTLAWVTHWRAILQAEPEAEAEQLAALEYLGELYVIGEPERGEDDQLWFRVAARRAGEAASQPEREGWVLAEHVAIWRPLAPSGEILGGQLLLDVDLEQQTLTVWREDVPVFATLIASGKPGHSTPVGLYRITNKRAYGKMSSVPDDPKPYWIDQVPWTMYFDGRYALHAAFWHNRFGHRTSHGCVNLSPRDAKRLFEMTTPTLPAGWLFVDEHPSDPGTLVRIRKGSADVPDRRVALVGG